MLYILLLISILKLISCNEYIECPIPDLQSKLSEKFQEYSACEYKHGSCYMKDEAGYKIIGKESTNFGIKVFLKKSNENYTLFSGDVDELIVEIINHEEYHLQVKIYDAKLNRYEIPYKLNLPEEKSDSFLYEVELGEENQSFNIQVKRKSTGISVFRTIGPLTFEDQFIQISTLLPSKYLYGIGEHHHVSLLHNFQQKTTFPLFARGQPVEEESIINEYGSHPYYINVEDKTGNSHSVLLYNSNALEYSTFMAGKDPSLTIRAIGGILDFHMFFGPTPEDLNIQYTKAIGRPAFPPYWSLGFHLSRWEYNSTQKIRQVIERTRNAGIPQDGQFFDIDYMDQENQFTYDPKNFEGLPNLLNELRMNGLKSVLILEPVLSINSDIFPSTERGIAADIFVKWINSSQMPTSQPETERNYLVGHVWPPDKVYFLDFINPNTQTFWENEIRLFKQNVHFDGLWIDMNEPKNFKTNVENPQFFDKKDPDWTLECPHTKYDSPPYPTKAANLSVSASQRLSDITICLSTGQTDGEHIYTHYDIHNLYGHSQAIATHKALSKLKSSRPFILSRSTFPGSGRYTFHWLGDNTASWEHLRRSIIGMIEFNMFGIPMIGADVCGFIGVPTEELCIRWMQLGAFYPFDRNHNGRRVTDQDPAYPGWTKVADISRDILMLRYQYIPYLYYLFYKAHYFGNSVIRPLFNVFPSDMDCRSIDDQFFWGDAIMVAPIVTEGSHGREIYFPKSVWYDLRSGNRSYEGGITAKVPVPLETISVYIRGGFIVPWQTPGLTTTLSRQNTFGLTVALNSTLEASGKIFWDDGISEFEINETFTANVSFSLDVLLMEIQMNSQVADGVILSTIQIYGYPHIPMVLYVNELEIEETTWYYDELLLVLNITINVPLNEDLSIRVA